MKKVLIGLAIVTVVTLGAAAWFWPNIQRAQMAATMFSGAEQVDNFSRAHELFPTATMTAPASTFQFPQGNPIGLPEKFTYRAAELDTAQFLEDTDTSALLVIHDGKLRFEDYWRTGGRDVEWLSMSVAKSFTSALVGIAVDEGHIRSIEEPVTDYVPSLKGSAYDGVRIKDVLQMSSGAAWEENYGDPESDIRRFGNILAFGGSYEEFLKTVRREREPGTFNRYNSAETQVLGLLLVAATGRPVADYMEEKLWQPLGAQSDAYWLVDDEGLEMVFAGLNATALDYAKMGELFRLNGVWEGKQIVPAGWVQASVTPDAPHLMPGDNPASDFALGYGYQWWVMDGDEGEYSAIGVYNQFIYVNPSRDLVIVKLSANSNYGTSEDGSSDKEFETIELFRAIGEALAPATAD